jgi:hypothetical protein
LKKIWSCLILIKLYIAFFRNYLVTILKALIYRVFIA